MLAVTLNDEGSQTEFQCTNDDCHIAEVQADITAANIAGHVDP